MPIEAQCPGCNRLLRVSDDYAGKQARCPVCSTIYQVPSLETNVPEAAATLPQDPAATQDDVVAAESARPDTSRWFMKTPEGQTFGPASRADLDRWVAEGRVTAECELRCDDGPWRSADQTFAVLRAPPAQFTPASRSPVARSDSPSGSPAYSLPGGAGVGRPAAYALPHRGGMILALALMGFVSGCPIMSIMAWVMGNGDLREMREGRMDPEGFGMTQAGYVLGLVLSMIWILGAVVGLFVVLLIAAAGK